MGSKLKEASKSMGLDQAFDTLDKLNTTDAERKAKEEEGKEKGGGREREGG